MEAALTVLLVSITIIFAILTVETREIIYSILFFALMCISIGTLYFILNAVYVGVFQLLIYAGAVVALMLAAVMLTKREVKK